MSVGSVALAGCDTIALDELVALAALQTRVDRKYILRPEEAACVLECLDDTTRVLDIGGERSLRYESAYFDTADLLSYTMAAQGRRRRFKLRSRSYLDSGDAFLEVKTRGGRSTTVKDRIPYPFDDRAWLTSAGQEYAGFALHSVGVERSPTELVHTLTTRYRRTTVFQPDTNGRATIDESLEWLAAPGQDAPGQDAAGRGAPEPRALLLPERVIIETKSGSRASAIDRALWAHGHRPTSLSKYATGLAALRPDLPSNKWARVLRRHFTPSLYSLSTDIGDSSC